MSSVRLNRSCDDYRRVEIGLTENGAVAQPNTFQCDVLSGAAMAAWPGKLAAWTDPPFSKQSVSDWGGDVTVGHETLPAQVQHLDVPRWRTWTTDRDYARSRAPLRTSTTEDDRQTIVRSTAAPKTSHRANRPGRESG